MCVAVSDSQILLVVVQARRAGVLLWSATPRTFHQKLVRKALAAPTRFHTEAALVATHIETKQLMNNVTRSELRRTCSCLRTTVCYSRLQDDAVGVLHTPSVPYHHVHEWCKGSTCRTSIYNASTCVRPALRSC